MKILLVNPPDTHQARTPGLQFLFSQHDFAPPLGLMYLKSHLDQRGHRVEIFNFQVPSPLSVQDFERYIYKYQPGLVGISVMTPYWYDACQIAGMAKRAFPGTMIVGGGPHITVFPQESVSRPEFDAVVEGEGENTLAELVSRLEAGQDLEGLAGLLFKRNGEIQRGAPRRVEPDPDVFPPPDRSNFDIAQHRLSADRFFPAAVVITSRGCPYRCGFCQNKDRQYRSRAAARVVDEIIACQKMGYRSVDFYDDTINHSGQRLRALCDELLARKLGLPWACRARVDRIDRESIKLMRRAGCYRVHLGVESANQRILDAINKGTTVEQAREAVRLAKEAGISVLIYLIIGFPGETREEAERTLNFAFDLDPDYCLSFPLIPLTGAQLYNQALQDPNFGGDYLKDFALDPSPHFRFKTWPTAMTEAEMLALLRSFYLKFYSRPRYLYRQLKQLRGIGDLAAKARTGFKLFTSK